METYDELQYLTCNFKPRTPYFGIYLSDGNGAKVFYKDFDMNGKIDGIFHLLKDEFRIIFEDAPLCSVNSV